MKRPMRDKWNKLKKLIAYRLTPDNAEILEKLYKNVLFQKLTKKLEAAPVFSDRFAMYDYISNEYINNKPIHYLEFGVFKGDSINKWTCLNTHSRSHFYGFDTFEGLPEDWSSKERKGFFNVDGQLPTVTDGRVTFIKGLFQQTLPTFLKDYHPECESLVHLDADLYSATLFCLTQLDRITSKGTIIIFDEFSVLLHEFSAFHDYTRSYYREWEFVCVSGMNYEHVAVRML